NAVAQREARMSRTLYNWLDVDYLVQKQRASGEWPDWLLGSSAYNDGLVIRVRPEVADQAINQLLSDWFGLRYDPLRGVLLEGTPDQARPFEVHIEKVAGIQRALPLEVQPTFRRIALFNETPSRIDWPDPFPTNTPAIAAFYSFKGGVGRTTHLLAYLAALASRASPFRCLVVDADLEAPGLTSLVHAEKSFGL